MDRKTGPNVIKLIIHKVSIQAVPPGGDLVDALKYLTTPGRLIGGMREATEWVFATIDAVKQARDGEKYGDDEAIAAEILKRIEKKQRRKE